jgi:hypothetical protein
MTAPQGIPPRIMDQTDSGRVPQLGMTHFIG